MCSAQAARYLVVFVGHAVMSVFLQGQQVMMHLLQWSRWKHNSTAVLLQLCPKKLLSKVKKRKAGTNNEFVKHDSDMTPNLVLALQKGSFYCKSGQVRRTKLHHSMLPCCLK